MMPGLDLSRLAPVIVEEGDDEEAGHHFLTIADGPNAGVDICALRWSAS
jgi:hypothetical protein